MTEDRRQDEKEPEVERRQGDRRTEQRVGVEIWLEEQVGQETSFRRTGNLSTGGVHLDRGFPKPVGTRVRLSFCLPGETKAIEVTGEVVSAHVEGDDLNTRLKFVDLDAEDEKRISAFIEELAARSS